MSYRRVSILILTVATIAGAAAAESPPYYMWIDDEGVLNFSQVKPRDREVETISKGFDPEMARRPGHEMPAPRQQPKGESGETTQAVPDYTMELPWEQDRVDGTPIEEVNARAREINCAIGRNMITSLNAHKNIFIKDEDGWWRKISEEQRQEKIRKAEKLIAGNCGSDQASSNPS